MPHREDPSSADLRAMIRRVGEIARDGHLDDVFTRMERDDQRDEADSFESGTNPAASHFDESSAWFGSSESGMNSGMGLDEEQETIDPPIGTSTDQARPDTPSLSNPSPSLPGATPSLSPPSSTPLFRPTRRPPMATLRVYDDDQRDAETVRIRQTPFVIGRQDGELVIGHERQMSRRHARIDRMQEGDSWRWYLGDLRSTNGTFLRVERAPLQDGTELLIGGELVRFVESLSGGAPSLLRVAPGADEERVALTEDVHLVGSDRTACLPFLADSDYLDPQHIRFEHRGGQWTAADLRSTNHLWVAISKRVELTDQSMFQIGEQRFGFHLP